MGGFVHFSPNIERIFINYTQNNNKIYKNLIALYVERT